MLSDSDLLHGLTPAQRDAVTHQDGPLLILAAAGSGKTRVITRRIAWLIAQKVRPGQILAITFTNKAAREMRDRVDKLIPAQKIMIRTFHSFGVLFLRQYADQLNIDRNFTIYDTDDRNKIVKLALESSGIDNVRFTPERIAASISKAKNQLLGPEESARGSTDFYSNNVARIYGIYKKKLRDANAVDFDDLLYLPALALRTCHELRAQLDDRYRYILVDEYQDTNLAQYEIARQLSRDHRNLCVVGDPDQSIYGWRGSDIRNILDFEKDFPDARVIKLDKNYRSTQSILNAAGAIIANNQMRKKKDLITDNETGEPVRVLNFDTGLTEADLVAQRIRQSVEAGTFTYRNIAVFVRMNALTRILESAFIRHGVPFQIVRGLAFFDRKENKDVLAYLRLLLNPNDNLSFLRAVAEPARGIGKVSLEHLQNFADAHELSLLAATSKIMSIPDIKGKAVQGLKSFYRLITELRSMLDLAPHQVIRAVIDKSGYQKMLSTSSEEDKERLANIEELVTAAQQFYDEDPSRSLQDFLEQITLSSDVDGWKESDNCVSVMTLHASKGLEFPVVYILAVEQGILPHERSISSQKQEEYEEERRLLFVGMTRAMKELYLCHAHNRQFRGQDLMAIASEFLHELPETGVERINLTQSYAPARNLNPIKKSAPSAPIRWDDSQPTQERPIVNTGADQGKAVDYQIGQIVQHEQYGLGQVAELNGFGALRRIKIRFPQHGMKTFIADKVKLRVVPAR